MTADEYTEAQTQIAWLGSIVLDLPLDEMRAAIAHSEAVGPIIDPTLWIRANRKLDQVKELVEAFQQATLDQPLCMRIERAAEMGELRTQLRDQVGGADRRATHHVAVAGCVFGEAVQEQVDVGIAVLVEAGQRVVEHRERAMRPRLARDVRTAQ